MDESPPAQRAPVRAAVAAAVAMVGAALLAVALAPSHVVDLPGPRFASLVPSQFGAWSAVTSPLEQVGLKEEKDGVPDPMQQAYDDSLLRTYARADGRQMMVALAYDKTQREEDRVHLPEICYVSQGFRILSDRDVTFSVKDASGQPIPGRQMLTQHGARIEAVSYWIRVGDVFAQNPWISRFYVLKEGLLGRVHDGMLVRVSEIIPTAGEAPRSFADQDAFLSELTNAIPAARARLIARAVREPATP